MRRIDDDSDYLFLRYHLKFLSLRKIFISFYFSKGKKNNNKNKMHDCSNNSVLRRKSIALRAFTIKHCISLKVHKYTDEHCYYFFSLDPR